MLWMQRTGITRIALLAPCVQRNCETGRGSCCVVAADVAVVQVTIETDAIGMGTQMAGTSTDMTSRAMTHMAGTDGGEYGNSTVCQQG